VINYDSFGRPPRRRGHGHGVLAAVAAVLGVAVLAVLVLGHVVTMGGERVPLQLPAVPQRLRRRPLHR